MWFDLKSNIWDKKWITQFPQHLWWMLSLQMMRGQHKKPNYFDKELWAIWTKLIGKCKECEWNQGIIKLKIVYFDIHIFASKLQLNLQPFPLNSIYCSLCWWVTSDRKQHRQLVQPGPFSVLYHTPPESPKSSLYGDKAWPVLFDGVW